MSAVYLVHTEDETEHGRITLMGVRSTFTEAAALAAKEAEVEDLGEWHRGQYAEWTCWQTMADGDPWTSYVITEQPLT